MKRVSLVCLSFLIAGVMFFGSAGTAMADIKDFEYGVVLGYTQSVYKYENDNGEMGNIFKSAWGGLRAMKRSNYPFLVGLGVSGAALGDVMYGEVNLPLALRIGLFNDVKADLIIAPGVGYAKNTNFRISKVVASGTGGIEIKKFIDDGVSVGVGAYYSAYTYSKLNSWKLAFVIGF